MSYEEADVLVVGGGPVGLTMVAELSYRGIKTILIERKPTTSNSAKAVNLSSRTMEHFRRLGLENKIQEASYPRDMLSTLSFSTKIYQGHVMFKKEFSSWGELADGAVGKELMFFQHGASVSFPMLCPQFNSEAVVRKHIEDTSETVTTFWGWRVTTLVQDDNGVTVKALNDDLEEKTFRGRYLIACDGGSSFIRKELGLHTYGNFVVAKACTITFRSPQLLEYMKRNKTTGFNAVVNRNILYFTILLNSKGEYALHIFLLPSISDEAVDRYVQNADEWVQSAIGSSHIPFEVMAASAYNMHSLITTKFREGRCYLAGDSAHQWLPAGGLGLNTGINDVADLSWKMEAMLKGYGGKYLVDSYEIERRPQVDSTRRFAMSFGNVAFVSSVFGFATSNFFFRWILGIFIGRELPRQFVEGTDLVLGFQYSNSNIIMHEYNEDGSVQLHCNEPSKFTPASLPGCRAPHVVLPDCPSIVDWFGKEFVILVVGGIEADLEHLRGELTNRGVPFSTYTYPPLPELVVLYNRKYYLIRPDGVIAWRSDYQPSTAESSRIMSIVLGHVLSPRLPPPILTYKPPQDNPSRSFIRDSIIRLCVTGLLCEYTQMPLTATCIYMVGFGVFVFLRAMSIASPPQNIQATSRHQAAVIDRYGSTNVLRIEPRHVGKFGPDDVLVRVHASSVSELDLEMREGCGCIYQKLSKLSVGGPYFPLVLGRDCSGEVVAVGDNVTKYLPGDTVFAAVPPYCQGTHAQLVAVNEKHVAFKPSNVNHKEAASLPWVAMTAWTALVAQAGLDRYSTRGKRILVHRGTSGVGSFAIQVLKAWGAHVTTTCASDNTALAHHLGADKVVNDQTGDFSQVLGGYDVVLDTMGGVFERPSLNTLKYYQGSVYVSLSSPYRKLVNSFGGVLGGLAFSWLYRYKIVVNRLFGGRGFYYSETEIDGGNLEQVCSMVESGAVKPLMDAVYSLDEVIDAHKHVESGQTRGKVVLSIIP